MPEIKLQQVEQIRDQLKESAKDIKLNVTSVLNSEHLNKDQVWGIALASAYYLRDAKLREAIVADAQADGIGDAVIADAQAAASLMGMNTVYYRFRHMAKKESYGNMQARLRMSWMLKPQTSKGDFELFSMAVAVLAGCEMCINAHEQSILQHDMGESHVHDCVRIAAVLGGLAVAMNL